MKDSKETEKKNTKLCVLNTLYKKKNSWLVIKYKTPYWEFAIWTIER